MQVTPPEVRSDCEINIDVKAADFLQWSGLAAG